jgi:hypothetical protein
MSNTTTYRLVKGKHSIKGPDGTRAELKPGDTLPLTEDQAKAFGDKFIREDIYVAQSKTDLDVTNRMKEALRAEVTAEIRTQIRAELEADVVAKYKDKVAEMVATARAEGKAEALAEAKKSTGS